MGNDKYAPYGTSILEPARRIWRQLVLIEDAMMTYRIVRSPERRLFKIDVGNVAPEDVEQLMQKVMTQMKRNQVVDASTGRVDLRYNPLSVDEDYFIPVRAGSATDITTLAGGTYTGDIEDVKYLRDKLFSALKVPMSYLSRGEGADEDKATLAQKDMRFARTIQRLQRSIVTELEKVGIIHLFTMGYRGDDLVNFKLSLNNPSKLAELQELEHWRTKFDTAAAATEGFFSRRWVAENVFKLSDEEFLRNQREMYYDRKFEASLEIEAEAIAGAPEGDLFAGDLEGGPPLEDLGAEGELGPTGEPAAGEAAPEEEDVLLAAPGRRDDDLPKLGQEYTRPGWKGSKHKITPDRRGMGATRRHFQGQWASEMRSSTDRNLYKGAQEIYNLARESLGERAADHTLNEENEIFEVNNEVKKLITELETMESKKQNGKNETQ